MTKALNKKVARLAACAATLGAFAVSAKAPELAEAAWTLAEAVGQAAEEA